MKNQRIFEYITFKTTTSLPVFQGKPTFDGVQIANKQKPSNKNNTFVE